MMKQYFEIKSLYEDAILFYRLGDFYEMFFEDAKLASSLLDLTLTTRNKNSADPVPLCGVPHHAADSYIAKLIAKGKKVVICEQVEDPKEAKGLVRREVVRVISPGVVLEERSLTGKANNFLFCFQFQKNNQFAVTLCDVSTGRFEYLILKTFSEVVDEMARMQVREVVYPESQRDLDTIKQIFQGLDVYHHAIADLYFDEDYARDLLKTAFRVLDTVSLGLEADSIYLPTLGGLLGYLKEIKILVPDLLEQPKERLSDSFMHLDETTIHNLELFRIARDSNEKGTLLHHLDACQTNMGSRRLAHMLRFPLQDVAQIQERLNSVEELVSHSELLDDLRESLGEVSDLERLSNKFIANTANARDSVSLRDSLERIPKIKMILSQCSGEFFKGMSEDLHDFGDLCLKISQTVVDEPPFSLKEGGIIRDGVHAELEELREIEKNGKTYIAQMETEERKKTGISSLKIRFNNVFGYYIDVTHTHRDKVPEGYHRKQTLTNSERYITDELKKYESKVLGAAERIKTIEYELFCDLRTEIQRHCSRIKETASVISSVDVIQSFAFLACKYHYTKPEMTTMSVLDLKGARHPILETMTDQFIPNDLCLDPTQNRVLIITGPNMAGKSTVMRMAALVTIMAQIGCFVPCESALIGICDRVFTRVGAQDQLQRGLSTFMVEMVETAKILREATHKSLILLDEIGRGTSTFDGLSIAWAVAEDLHDRLSARTLFATHYHELCDLANQKKGIQNYHMSVKEWNGEIIFLRKLKTGGTNRSYGVAVANMAGLPTQTIKRAREILKLLEVKDLSFQLDLDQASSGQASLFQSSESQVLQKLREVEVNQMTPVEALNFLSTLKETL